MTADMKAGVTVGELHEWADALLRVISSVRNAPPMFFGGPPPADVINAVEQAMREKIKGAAPGALLNTGGEARP